MLWGTAHRCIPARIKGHGLAYHLSKDRDLVGAYLSVWTQPERTRLYNPELKRLIGDEHAENYKIGLIRQSKANDYLSRMQELDMRTVMVDDVLTKVDRVSMVNSLEVRVPLLDHKLAELSFRIPSRLKYKNGEMKYILKKTMERHLPEAVLSHKKQGFTIPLKMWFKDSLKDYVHDRLLGGNSKLADYVDMDYVRKIVIDNEKGMRSGYQKVCSLIVLDALLVQNMNGAR